MKKEYLIYFYLSALGLFAQNDIKNVNIKVISNELDSTSRIYISGNQPQFGNWSPNTTELKFKEKYWERNFKFSPGKTIQFKFTLGSWETEALTEEGKIPGNHNFVVTKDTTVTYVVKKWKSDNAEKLFEGQVTGTVIYHSQLKYEDLLPRDIAVWLPPNYYEDLNERYPVLYMHDGQNLFNPKTSFTNVDWQIDEAADSLIKNDIIEPLIIVGIYNTKKRSVEYSDTEKGGLYLKFIIESLKPFIDNTYRTKPGRYNSAVGGSSSGGLVAFLLAWNYSDYFSKAACFSPAFKYDNFDFTRNVKSYTGPKKDIELYFYNGGLGVDDFLQEGVDSMRNALLRQGFVESKDLFLEIDQKAEHTENAWAKYVPSFLKIFYLKEN